MRPRHALHVRWALLTISGGVSVLRDVGRIDAVWEAENYLDVRVAGICRQSSTRSRLTVFGAGLAPPGYGIDVLVDVGLTLGAGVPGYSVEVGREWNLGFVVTLVVRAGKRDVDFGIVASIDVVEGRSP